MHFIKIEKMKILIFSNARKKGISREVVHSVLAE
jgi:hypothetical protein